VEVQAHTMALQASRLLFHPHQTHCSISHQQHPKYINKGTVPYNAIKQTTPFNTDTRQYSSTQGALAEGLARGCLFGHYIQSCLFLTLPYMSLTSKAQQQKVRMNT